MTVFSCSKCSKEFTSQGSLARHENNHIDSVKHVCQVCGVIFRRRDLLTRHGKIHGLDTNPSDQSDADASVHDAADRDTEKAKGKNKSKDKPKVTGEKTASRKRCHTACISCRDQKVKCDGQYPCARCSAGQKSCVYRNTSGGRRSLMPISHDTETTPGTAFDNDDDADCFGNFTRSATDSTGSDLNNPTPEQAVAMDGSAEIPWESISAADAAFWPWLHEGLFLSDDSLGLLGVLGSADDTFVGDPFAFPGFSLADTSHAEDCSQPDWMVPLCAQPTTPRTCRPTAGPGAHTPPREDGGADATALKQRAVDDLISLASQYQNSSVDASVCGFWSRATSDLVTAFDFGSDLDANCNTSLKRTTEALDHFIKLYIDHFHPLWPMLPRRTLINRNLHPVLYLVLTSIGAMYLGPVGSQYGAMMHNVVRRHLVMFLEVDIIQDSLLWLAQARLLTQVAALYFGQPRAFSYAQHLGTLLTSQARRMCIFSGSIHKQRMSQFEKAKGLMKDAERFDLWLAIEERRRLAFGIFRGGIFTSVLLNTKPLITLDEIDLEFPCCDAVWNGQQDLDPRVSLEMIEHDYTPSRNMRASDIYSILLERSEVLPPLEPGAHELLLFGLQPLIWRFSYDRQIAQDLVAEIDLEPVEIDDNDELSPPKKRRRRDTFTSEADSLSARSYEMSDLVEERQRLMAALSKWERGLTLAKSFARTERDRSYLLSGLILYHLSFLRLYAPIEDLHQIQYRISDRRPIPKDLIAMAKTWTSTPKARLALEKVRMIWMLITQQFQLGKERSKFNFNAFIGLHHGAAVLWAYNGTQAQVDRPRQGQSQLSLGPQGDHQDMTELLKSFLDLFHKVSPARWSSFADVRVPDAEFPNDSVSI
ncbi:zinc finger protein [Fusarium sporotrichioides]|uniref:Zinc finger protein n=1 Tax=Fusarium sporotrichioides TaxID=5514 RepID=A0A395SGS0_FUSSP|nr:zinc finger protein [Fusarium sporotrichioides]